VATNKIEPLLLQCSILSWHAGFYQKDKNPSLKEYFEKIDYDLNGNITSFKRFSDLKGSENVDGR
jgi:hypothetical protein